MTPLQAAYAARATRALDSARRAVDAGDGEDAVNRAYYACYYAAQAVVAADGDEPRTHAGAHRLFAQRVVAPGLVPRDVGRILPDAYRLRQRSDYDAMAVTDLDAAADLVRDAERFVDVVGRLAVG